MTLKQGLTLGAVLGAIGGGAAMTVLTSEAAGPTASVTFDGGLAPGVSTAAATGICLRSSTLVDGGVLVSFAADGLALLALPDAGARTLSLSASGQVPAGDVACANQLLNDVGALMGL